MNRTLTPQGITCSTHSFFLLFCTYLNTECNNGFIFCFSCCYCYCLSVSFAVAITYSYHRERKKPIGIAKLWLEIWIKCYRKKMKMKLELKYATHLHDDMNVTNVVKSILKIESNFSFGSRDYGMILSQTLPVRTT